MKRIIGILLAFVLFVSFSMNVKADEISMEGATDETVLTEGTELDKEQPPAIVSSPNDVVNANEVVNPTSASDDTNIIVDDEEEALPTDNSSNGETVTDETVTDETVPDESKEDPVVEEPTVLENNEEENVLEQNEDVVGDNELTEVNDNVTDEEINENVVEGYEVVFTHRGYKVNMPGGSMILLSNLTNKLNINISLSDIEEISISNEEILKIDKVENSNDYVFRSLKSFDSEEELIIRTKSGDEYIINVTDPEHEKLLFDNGDGTYKLSLDITGEADTTVEISSVNVIVVFDTSNSMVNNGSTTYMEYATGRYGHVGNNYVNLYTRGNNNNYTQINNDSNVAAGTTVYSRSGNTYSVYTGNRYVQTRRADAAEKTLYDFTTSLFGYQDVENNPSNIQMALITFNHTATNVLATESNPSGWTSNKTDITGRISNTGLINTKQLPNNSGTNYEAALKSVLTLLASADADPTFVIFITDGAPSQDDGTHNNGYYSASLCYGPSQDEALHIENYNTADHTYSDPSKSNTTLYGIFAYGNEEDDYLDDVIYYANHNGTPRPASEGGETGNTVDTDNYYKASDTTQLNRAISEIFNNIVETLGITAVSINDGTTQSVTTTTGTISNLLVVDTDSYEYWLTIPVQNNQFTRIDPVTGETITYTVTRNSNTSSTITWTIDGTEKSVNVEGALPDGVTTGKLKYRWVKNALYNYDAPEAEFNNGAVEWDLSDVGTLLNGVTYTVTFDVWPSQTTLDIIADLKNDPDSYADLDANIKKYIIDNGNGSYTLKTNTAASLSFTDTRPNPDVTEDVPYEDPIPVETKATEMLAISKKWSNLLDDRTQAPITVAVLRDGEQWNTITLDSSNGWAASIYIAVGIMTTPDGEVYLNTTGHEFSFGELGSEAYNWELKSEIVRPMLINGVLTMLIKQGTEEPEDGTYYKIGDYYYLVGTLEDGVAKLTATNERRSWLDLEKTLNYDENAAHFDDTIFYFDINVVDPTGADVWFSVMDKATEALVKAVDGLVVTGATAEDGDTGYYHAGSGSTFTVGIKTGWNLRLINLLTGTTYTITETDIDSKFAFDKINYVDTTYIDEDGEEVDYEPEITNTTIEGEIMGTNTAYGYEYVNKNVNTDIIVTKIWDDEENAYNNRPDNITLELSDGTKVIAQPTKVVDEETGNWVYTYEGLPVYDSTGEAITYTLAELGDIVGYAVGKVTGNAKDGFTVTNTLERVTSTVKKVWDDNNNQDGIRPTSVTVTFSDGTTYVLDAKNNWTVTVEDLPAYVNKEEATYSWSEEEANIPDGYTPSSEVEGTTTTITNSHTPEQIEIKIAKVWDDNNDQDGLRANGATAVITLYANGTATTNKLEATEDDDTTFTVDKYANGSEITYTVVEDTIEGYTASDPVKTTEGDVTVFTITNSHTPEQIQIKVVKVWDDNDDQDGLRANGNAVATITLYANGTATENVLETSEDDDTTFTVDKYVNGSEITYTVEEATITGYTTSGPVKTTEGEVTVYTFTNVHKPDTIQIKVVKVWDDNDDQDGLRANGNAVATITLYANGTATENVLETSEDDDITFTVDKYADGSEITYTVVEGDIEGYTASDPVKTTEDDVTVFTITNSHTPEQIQIKIAKVWDDNDDQDGLRANGAKAVITLYANGTATTNKLEATEDDDATFTVDKYANGSEITYTVVEDTIEGYTASDPVKTTEDGVVVFTITNTHEAEQIEIKVVKSWDDNDDQDGLRKNGNAVATITLYANGTATENVLTTSEDDDTTFTVDKYANGSEITYTVVEDTIEGYTASDPVKTTEGDVTVFTITNSHTPEQIQIKVVKVWDDNDDQDGLRANGNAVATITLYANGTATENVLETSEDDDETFTVDKYANGVEIEYTVVEEDIDGYTASDAVETTEGDVKVFTITNTHEPEQIEIKIAKVWDDNDDQDGLRKNGTKAVITLYANGTATENVLETSEDDDTTFTVDKYANGVEIEYTVVESDIEGYTASDPVKTTEDGVVVFTITNSHTPEQIEIKVVKSWDDNKDQDGLRKNGKAVATITLYADGEATENVLTTAEDDDITFTVDKYANGVEIEYTVVEDTIEGYTASDPVKTTEDDVVVFTITNSHTPEETEVTVKKIWEDNDNQDGKRPTKIVLTLSNGQEIELNEDNNWEATVTGLPKYNNGVEIEYTVEEKNVPEGYEVSYDGLTVTNTHEPEVIDIKITKIWSDVDDQDGVRPETITVRLYANGEEIEVITLDEECEWKAVIEGLDKYADGKEIEYSVTEDTIELYEAVITGDAENGFTIENFYSPKGGDNPPPKTGDNITLYVITLILSLMGMGFSFYFKKRYN